MIKGDFPSSHRFVVQATSMAKKGQKKGARGGRKLGQAAMLTGKMWTQWRNHILKTSSTWLFVAITLSHALCARITEVLKLKGSDFHWAAKTVTIAALKRQPQASWGNCAKKLIYKDVFSDFWHTR